MAKLSKVAPSDGGNDWIESDADANVLVRGPQLHNFNSRSKSEVCLERTVKIWSHYDEQNKDTHRRRKLTG